MANIEQECFESFSISAKHPAGPKTGDAGIAGVKSWPIAIKTQHKERAAFAHS
jgi:hypothetical protein